MDVIVNFAKVKALTDSTELLVESIKDSKVQWLTSWGIQDKQHAHVSSPRDGSLFL